MDQELFGALLGVIYHILLEHGSYIIWIFMDP